MDLIQHMLSPGSEHKSLTHTHSYTLCGSITTGYITLLVPAYHLHACTQKTSDFKATVAAAHCRPCFHTEGDCPSKHVAQTPNPQPLATRWWWNAAVHHNQWLSRLLHDPKSAFMGLPSFWGSCTGLQICWCNSLFECQVVGLDKQNAAGCCSLPVPQPCLFNVQHKRCMLTLSHENSITISDIRGCSGQLASCDTCGVSHAWSLLTRSISYLILNQCNSFERTSSFLGCILFISTFCDG